MTPNEIEIRRKQFISSISLKIRQGTITPENTVVIGVLTEPPYAEFMGDVNCIYCYNTTGPADGCLYNNHANQYMPL